MFIMTLNTTLIQNTEGLVIQDDDDVVLPAAVVQPDLLQMSTHFP